MPELAVLVGLPEKPGACADVFCMWAGFHAKGFSEAVGQPTAIARVETRASASANRTFT